MFPAKTDPRRLPAAHLPLLSILLVAASACQSRPAPKTPAAPRYETRAVHDPDGTGKFYMGREIAQVVGPGASEWLDRATRADEEQPDKLIDALKFKPGEVVADIGAGSGYLSFRIAPKVTPGGKVLAEDIQPDFVDLIKKRAKEKGLANVEPVLGTITDPKLPPNSVDTELLVDVYHEFDHPYEMAVNMIRGLKPGGRLVFVEYRAEDPSVPIKPVHKMTEVQVKREMSIQALKWNQTLEMLPRQHIIVFRKTRTSATGNGR